MKKVEANNPKESIGRLYLRLNIIKYAAMGICLILIFGSLALLKYTHLTIGISISCFIIGIIGAPFTILVPQIFWRCPFCKERLNTRRKGILVKPGKNCPHCGAEFS